jgi:hypothetical protein
MQDDSDDEFDNWAVGISNEAYEQLELREHFIADLMEARGEPEFDVFVRRERADNARVDRILAREVSINEVDGED